MTQFYRICRYATTVLLTICVAVSCKKDETTKTLNNQKQLKTFKIDSISGKVNDTNHTISIVVPYATDLAHVTPVITISEKATVTPSSGTQVDLSKPVNYKVTAEDGTAQTYTVTATKGENTENRILEFKIKSKASWGLTYTGVIDEAKHTVTFKEAFLFLDIDSVPTEIKISDGATITPSANDTIDFSLPVTYKVKSKSGIEQEYTVKVLNTEISFNFGMPLMAPEANDVRWGNNGSPGSTDVYPEEVEGLENKYFSIFYALETEDVSNMVFKKVVLSPGATISPAIDVAQNFNNDVAYTVTSQSGDTRVIVVRCIKKKIVQPNEFYTTLFKPIDANGNVTIYYACASDVQQVWLVNIETGSIQDCTITYKYKYATGYAYSVLNVNKDTFPVGKYQVKVKLSDGSEVLTHTQISYGL